jgi:hypothetical protein
MHPRELSDPGRIVGHRGDLASPLENAENRQGRHQQRERLEDRLPAAVPGLQPEPQSNDGVDPGNHQNRQLKPAA